MSTTLIDDVLQARREWRAARTRDARDEALDRYHQAQRVALHAGFSGLVIGAIYDAQMAERKAGV